VTHLPDYDQWLNNNQHQVIILHDFPLVNSSQSGYKVSLTRFEWSSRFLSCVRISFPCGDWGICQAKLLTSANRAASTRQGLSPNKNFFSPRHAETALRSFSAIPYISSTEWRPIPWPWREPLIFLWTIQNIRYLIGRNIRPKNMSRIFVESSLNQR